MKSNSELRRIDHRVNQLFDELEFLASEGEEDLLEPKMRKITSLINKMEKIRKEMRE